jgi:hypothetical protein
MSLPPYPTHTAIKLIFDNHSAHISKETKAWLADQPAGLRIHLYSQCFDSLSTARGSTSSRAFSKLARSVLRHIRVTSKQELKDRSAHFRTTAVDPGPSGDISPGVFRWDATAGTAAVELGTVAGKIGIGARYVTLTA